MTEKTIIIDRDFTHCPGGRYRRHGEFSGEEFRDDMLVPALQADNHVVVVLDGTEGYASSFLEEAFGGLVRERSYTQDQLRSRLEIRADDPAYVIYKRLADQYIRDARAKASVAA